LRASEEYFREVIENVSDIIFVVDRSGTIKYTSPSIERVLGYPAKEVVGKNAFQFIHPSDARRSLVVFWKAIRLRDSSIHDTFCIVHKDGSERFLEGLGKNLLDHPSIAGFIMIVHDVTENRKAEAALRESRDQLRKLAARLETVREKERKYIAHEMHEEFGQILSAIKIQMSAFARRYSQDEIFVSGVSELSGFIDEAIVSVRKISTDLWPGVLDLLGLTTAIEWQAKEFSKEYKIACNIDVPPKGVHLPEQSSIILFRMLQDALKNVAEHAQASRVQLRLNVDAEYVELTIEDNGKGISEEQLNSPSSIGLVLLKERALSIGGSAEIKATEGKGTTVLIRIPRSS
jgi:two-component system sensor histidine kinase UhpB